MAEEKNTPQNVEVKKIPNPDTVVQLSLKQVQWAIGGLVTLIVIGAGLWITINISDNNITNHNKNQDDKIAANKDEIDRLFSNIDKVIDEFKGEIPAISKRSIYEAFREEELTSEWFNNRNCKELDDLGERITSIRKTKCR